MAAVASRAEGVGVTGPSGVRVKVAERRRRLRCPHSGLPRELWSALSSRTRALGNGGVRKKVMECDRRAPVAISFHQLACRSSISHHTAHTSFSRTSA